MHRDVKPHNVMIDHEKKKVRCALNLHGSLNLLKQTSCASLIGDSPSSTMPIRNTTSALPRDISKARSY